MLARMPGKALRRLAWLSLALPLALAGAVGWLASQALSSQPRVALRPMQHVELWQGRVIADHLLFPGPGGLTPSSVTLARGQVDLVLNYLLARARLGQARVSLTSDTLRVDATLLSPYPALGRYLNAGIELRPAGTGLALGHLLAGETRLPAWLSRILVRHMVGRALPTLDADLVDGLLAGMSLRTRSGQTYLHWRGGSIHSVMARARAQLLGMDEAGMRPYRERLARLAATRPRPDFPQVLGELFRLAAERSTQADPVRENRALLLALAEQVNGLGGRLQSETSPRGLRLAGRGDFVEHLTLSAALAVAAGGEVADAAGLMKEVGDTQLGGSGFSFTDLAVDRAGTRLGRLAVASARDARRVQALLAGRADESLFLPPVRDLPEFLPEVEFRRRFGGVDGAGYAELVREIDRRIDGLPLYRPGSD